MTQAFPFLLLPAIWSSRNRARRREPGDVPRAVFFGSIALVVCGALFQGAYWLTTRLMAFDEFGDYLLRLGLSWLFMTMTAFLAFSGVVTALSTFFLADDLRLLVAAPITARRLFLARFARTVAQSSWMVVAFVAPILLGIGAAYCAPWSYYPMAAMTVAPLAVIPVALGAAVALILVNVFPARRARDLLLLVSVLFAASLVLMLRFLQPERLLRVETLPDITDFFATLQSPLTPLLPSFWAGEALFAGLQGGMDTLHATALWTTATAFTVFLAGAEARWHFSGYSRSQEASRTRFNRLAWVDRVAAPLPLTPVRRHIIVKDVKVFLRDASQSMQLLPLVALVLLYVYNFSVIDLNRVPYMSGAIRNFYAFVNVGMAGFVVATIAARFIFPAVSTEGMAFWVVRTAPISSRDYLWSKFWIGLLPLLILTETLTVAANHLMGVEPFLKVVSAFGIALITMALVGLAIGLGARYPRFTTDATQAAGSYGGVAFMSVAVLFVIVISALIGWPASLYVMRQLRGTPLSGPDQLLIIGAFTAAVVLSTVTCRSAMRFGVEGLEALRR